MKVKTFPLHFSEDYHQQIKIKAAIVGKSINQFILDAIQKEMEVK